MAKKKKVAAKTRHIEPDDLREVKMQSGGFELRLEGRELPSHLDNQVQMDWKEAEGHEAVHVVYRCRLVGHYGKAADVADNPPLEIQAAFQVAYVASGGRYKTTSARIGEFVTQQGVIDIWPFWREYVGAAMTRMGLPRLLLPAKLADAVITQHKAKRSAK